jgi:hypothetical protein
MGKGTHRPQLQNLNDCGPSLPTLAFYKLQNGRPPAIKTRGPPFFYILPQGKGENGLIVLEKDG